MKLVDDLFNRYRYHLSGDEEDANIITFAVLEQMDREDLLELIEEMDEQELYDMVGLYMLETLKQKMGAREMESSLLFRRLH